MCPGQGAASEQDSGSPTEEVYGMEEFPEEALSTKTGLGEPYRKRVFGQTGRN